MNKIKKLVTEQNLQQKFIVNKIKKPKSEESLSSLGYLSGRRRTDGIAACRLGELVVAKGWWKVLVAATCVLLRMRTNIWYYGLPSGGTCGYRKVLISLCRCNLGTFG